MGFPNSVFSFTTKSAGQTIQSATVNDLQNEVAALESGLIVGPLSLPATIFASRPSMPPPSIADLTGSTTGLPNASTTAVAWPTETILIGALHSTSVNPERLTPDSTGVWVLNASLTLAGAFTVGSTMALFGEVLDSSGTRLDWKVAGAMSGTGPTMALFAAKRFDTIAGSTQWLRVVAEQRTASTNSLVGTLSFCRFYKL